MKCDGCFSRDKDVNPFFVFGETFYYCRDCYKLYAEQGFLDIKG
jgi:hypothetical protein